MATNIANCHIPLGFLHAGLEGNEIADKLAKRILLYILKKRPTSSLIKVKVNCTLVQALRLCTGGTAHRGSRGIALLFLDHSTRRD